MHFDTRLLMHIAVFIVVRKICLQIRLYLFFDSYHEKVISFYHETRSRGRQGFDWL